MRTAVVTGSAGLVGSEAARELCAKGFRVVGIDNDMRAHFFGRDASTRAVRDDLLRELSGYRHEDADIRDTAKVDALFAELAGELELVVHTAAQPSHDWAAGDPQTDFTINANGTLALLEATRRFAPEASFVHVSTNKVYGDLPNQLPLVELERRFDLPEDHAWYGGIDETMSLDRTTHSLFGVSKTAGDLLVQEYGRYFGMKTVCFRGGCLTGPAHAGARLHGFLSYLMRCTVAGEPYTVFGYQGKQVRDNLHSHDLVAAMLAFHASPTSGAVYNIGGGRANSCSMLEAIDLCQEIAGRELAWSYDETNRVGDHLWWISDNGAFERDHPGWRQRYGLEETLREIHRAVSS